MMNKEVKYDIFEFIITTIIWIFSSYLIPIINIMIILLVNNNIIEKSQSILSIIWATNTCFIISIITTLKNNQKDRNICRQIVIGLLVISCVFFSIITYNIEINASSTRITNVSTILSIIIFLISCICGFIAKNDEWKEDRELRESKKNIKKAHTATEGSINGVKVKV